MPTDPASTDPASAETAADEPVPDELASDEHASDEPAADEHGPARRPPASPRVALVTGVSRHLGGRLAARLAADPSIQRVIGVDAVAPDVELTERLGRTEYVRADIRNASIGRLIADAEVDTVVHVAVRATAGGVGGRASMKEFNVIGTMQLLAACQRSASVRKLVVRSSTAVYGSGPRDPAVFTEEMQAKADPPGGYAKDATDVERYVRGFQRRRDDVVVSVLRLANMLSPRIDTPLAHYFALPVAPTVLGFDPRLQFLHIEDAIDVLQQATLSDHDGTYNVAGRGSLLLSQAIRRAGRIPLPMPSFAAPWLGMLIRQLGALDFSREQVLLLQYGRVVDTSKLERSFGRGPKRSSAEAFDDFVRGSDLSSLLSPENVRAAERAVARRFGATGRPGRTGQPSPAEDRPDA